MREWKSQLRRGLVAILTLAVAGGGTASAVSWMQPEEILAEEGSLIGVSLEDIEDAARNVAAISREQTQAVSYASDGKGLKSNEAAIYNALKTCIQQVARGEKTSTEFSLQTKLSESALANIDVNTIVSYLLNDCPFDLYWHDKTSTDENGKQTDGVYCKYYKDGRIVFSFKVSQAYRTAPDELYKVNGAYMDTVNRAVQKAKSIVDTNQNNTDYDKLLNYRNAICDLVYYDEAALWDTNYGNSYQVISVFDDDIYSNVVCEGYAKAFKYLCDLTTFDNEVECYTVSGTTNAGAGAGEHMWNVVRIGGQDGESYLVDVTNCDSGTIGYPVYLFMADNLAGSVDTDYTYSDGWSSITYQYSADARAIYGSRILSLNNANHDEEAQIHVKGNNTNARAPISDDETPVTPSAPTEDGSANQTVEDSSNQQGEGTGAASEPTTNFAFAVTEVDKVYGDEDFTESVSGYEDSKKITYTSSDPTVAEVNKRGKVEIKNAGTTVITAESESKEKASYTLNVSPKKLTWDISGLYAVNRSDTIKDKNATLYGEIKLEGILPEDKDRNSQFSFGSEYLTGTYSETVPGRQTVTLNWKDKAVTLTKSSKTGNYEMPEGLPELIGKITTLTRLDDPELETVEAETGLKYKLEMEDGISEVPESLKNKKDLNTPPKIEAALKSDLSEYGGIPEENIVVYDVSLSWQDKASDDEDDEGEWVKVKDENFPEEGLTITLPYPGEMPRNVDDIVISHMFVEDMYTSSPGEVEHPVVIEETVDGIKFTVNGLSPIAVGWRTAEGVETQDDIPSPVTTETSTQNPQNNPDSGTGQQNNTQNGQQNESNKSPVTGDTMQILIYAILIGLCAATIKGIQAVRRGNKKKS